MDMTIEGPERRQGNLSFEPGTGLLVVGARTAVLDRAPAPEAVLGQYVELVVAQREVKPLSHADLRNRELVQLSALLELPQAELDALIDRELARLLGGTGAGTVLAGGATGWRSRRRLVAAGGIALLLAAGTAITVATTASSGTDAVTDSVTDAVTGAEAGTDAVTGADEVIDTSTGSDTEQIDLPDGGTATRTESAPAPVGEDGTDVGTAVVIERNP